MAVTDGHTFTNSDAEPEADEELAVEAMLVRERREAVVVPAPITPFNQLVAGKTLSRFF